MVFSTMEWLRSRGLLEDRGVLCSVEILLRWLDGGLAESSYGDSRQLDLQDVVVLV
jgi:hypothetical protein